MGQVDHARRGLRRDALEAGDAVEVAVEGGDTGGVGSERDDGEPGVFDVDGLLRKESDGIAQCSEWTNEGRECKHHPQTIGNRLAGEAVVRLQDVCGLDQGDGVEIQTLGRIDQTMGTGR